MLGLIEFLDLVGDRSLAERRATAMAGALAAERLGYHRVWIPEHHGRDAPSTNPVPLAAVVGSHTTRIRVGTAVVLARVRDPWVTAEDLGTAAAFCGDRLDVGFGRGGAPGPAARVWVHRDDAATAAAVATVVDVLRHGTGWIAPLPPGFETWMHGASGGTAESAARSGAGYCHALFLNPDEDVCRTAIRAYRETGGTRAAVAVAVVAGPDPARVRADAARQTGLVLSCAGPAADCARELRAIARRVGADEVVVAEFSTTTSAHVGALTDLYAAWAGSRAIPGDPAAGTGGAGCGAGAVTGTAPTCPDLGRRGPTRPTRPSEARMTDRNDDPFVLLRAATLSVAESARMVADDDVDDPVALAAVRLASGGQVVDDLARGRERARDTVARYVARMGGRATPYGAFAGVAVGEVGRERALALQGRDAHRVRVRIDVDALHRVVAEAFDEVAVTARPLRRNPSARVEGEVVRFHRAGDVSADVVTLRRTAVVADVLDELGTATLTGTELVARLSRRRPSAAPDALAGFVERLVSTGLLLVAADLLAPGEEPADRAVALLRTVGAHDRADAVAALAVAAGGDHPLDADLPGRLDAAWTAAAERVPVLADVPEAHHYHLDTEIALESSTLDRRTVDDLSAALARVHAFSAVGSPSGPGRGAADELRDAVRARYEDAEIGLLTAADLENGARSAPARGASKVASSAGVRRSASEDALRVHPQRLRVVDRFLRTGEPVDLADVAGLDPDPAHGARSVQVALLDDYEGRYRSVLVGGGGRSPLALVARFCVGRPEFEGRARDWLDGEPDDGELRAELSYDPGGRIANVLVRPGFAEHVIALGGSAGGTLSLDRLRVRVDGERLRLRDADTGRPVAVELNTAHNVDMLGQDPLYSVLGHLASPGGVAWTWGGLAHLSHLPRVTCGSVIVAPEQWRLSAAEVAGVRAAPDPAARLRELLPGVRGRRWVGTGVMDHVLPIDLTSSRSVAVALARSGDADIEVVELPQLECPATTGPAGGHVTEAVIALRTPAPATAAPPRVAAFDAGHGPAWAYVKYHTGVAAADQVAARAGELADTLRERGVVDDWFFLRYSDSGADGLHVRVRMRPTSPDVRDDVVAALDDLGRQLRAAGLVSRVVHDDYVPELARYGGARGLRAAERLFAADASALARFVASAPSEEDRLYRGVADTVAWCRTAYDDPEQQQEFLRRCGTGLGLAFTPTGNAHGRYYRDEHTALVDALAAAEPDVDLTGRLRDLVDAVRELGEPWFGQVLGSALHLHHNRLFAFDPNRMEFLCYDFARRVLREQHARARA